MQHLGFFSKDYIPTERGFDHFFGHLSSKVERFTFERNIDIIVDNIPSINFIFDGIDFVSVNNDNINNGNTKFLDNSDYSNNDYVDYVFGNFTKEVLISNYINQSYDKPFFFFLAYGGPHGPDESPQEQLNRYTNNSDPYIAELFQTYENRAICLGMMSAIDDSINEIVAALKSDINGIWNNTLIVVSNDNGGNGCRINYPLRGGKRTLWEGGTKSPAFITGGALNNELVGEYSDELIHVSDWLLTFLAMMDGVDNETVSNIKSSFNMDGYDLSEEIFMFGDYASDVANDTTYTSKREEMVYNLQVTNILDPCNSELFGVQICGAFRWKNWKLVIGNQVDTFTSQLGGWRSDIADYGIVDYYPNETLISYFGFDNNKFLECNLSIQPNFDTDISRSQCPFNNEACLFNLLNDPCEYFDVKEDYPEIYEFVAKMFINFTLDDSEFYDPSLEDENAFNYDIPLCFPSFNFDTHWKPWTPWSDGYTLFVILIIFGVISLLYLCALCCHPTCIDICLVVFIIVTTIAIVDDWSFEIDLNETLNSVYLDSD